jgi:ATP/maltotriose-dependent transcriptional regulator MalT
VQEGRRWLGAALDAAPDAPRAVRNAALLGDGLLAYLVGDVQSILARSDEIAGDGTDPGDRALPLALVLRGFVHTLFGGDDAAIAADVARGQELARLTGLEWVQAEVAMTLGQLARVTGDIDGALVQLDRAARLAADLGHTWAQVSSLWIASKVLVDTGRPQEALASMVDILALTTGEEDVTSTMAGLLTSVGALAAAGRPRDAAVLLGAVRTNARLVGYDPVQMDLLDGQRYVASTEEALGTDALAAALAEGAPLDLAGAVALVERLAAG